MRTPLALLAALSLSGCWDLPAGDKTSVYYWSDLFLDMYADELIVGDLEPGPAHLEAPKTVLLITGVTIRAKWFDPIVARLKRDGFVPVVYEPPELLSGNLFQASAELAQVVERVQAESGQDKIDILAECTGGVIARYYLQSLGGDARVSRLVTFVSPQHGVGKAPMAAAIAGWPALYDLSPGSPFLEAVNNAPLPANVPITSIYTCSDEYIQPYETSIIPGATNIGLCDEFVGHFQTFYDPAIYDIMFEALTKPTPEELAAAAGTEEPADGGTEPADEGTEDEGIEEPTDDDGTAVAPASDAPAPEANADGTPELSPTDEAPQTVPERPEQPEVAGLGCAGGGGGASGLGALALALLFIRMRRARA